MNCKKQGNCPIEYEKGGCPDVCTAFDDMDPLAGEVPAPNDTVAPPVMDTPAKKGNCGICGVMIFENDVRFKRGYNEPYVCNECHELLDETCKICTRLFACDLDHSPTVACKM